MKTPNVVNFRTAQASLSGGRYYSNPANIPPPGSIGNVFSDNFDYAVARSASAATKLAAFRDHGWDSGALENPSGTPGSGTYNTGGYIYTATPASLGLSANISGSSRVLVQEFYPISWRPRAAITGATSASPIVFTCSSTANWNSGASLTLTGLPGDFGSNLNNTSQIITVIDGTHFSVAVNGSGYAAYTSGGQVATPHNDFQPNPYIQLGNQSSANTFLPANLWIQIWLTLIQSYTVDIGAGATLFTSTLATRDKFFYPSRAELPNPLYNATFNSGLGLSWDFLLGAGGYEGINPAGVPAQPTDECFIGLDTGGTSYGVGVTNSNVGASDAHKLYQNLNNTVKIVKAVKTELRLHMDCSGAQGIFEAWLKPQGSARTKVSEYIGGVTAGIGWPIPADRRLGHKAFQLSSVVNGNSSLAGDHAFAYDAIDIADNAGDLPEYDP